MKKRNEQICLKLAGELRAALELEATERGRSLSNLMRRILIDHAAARAAERGQIAA